MGNSQFEAKRNSKGNVGRKHPFVEIIAHLVICKMGVRMCAFLLATVGDQAR